MAVTRLQGWTSAGRNETIAALQGSIGRRGWILGCTPFSSKAVVVTFEIPAASMAPLLREIEAAGVSLRPEDAAAASRAGAAAGAIEVSLRVLFVHDGTDLRIEVPPVPG